MNLTDITTPQIAKRGSIRLLDPVTGVQYSLHESGYVRRYIRGRWSFQAEWMPYQLNRASKIRNNTVRHLASIDEQITILRSASVRGTVLRLGITVYLTF